MDEAGVRPRVKICGVTRRQDGVVAKSAGADYVGMILSPGFERSVTLDVAAEIALDLGLETVAVLVDESADSAERIARSVGVAILQLHGNEAPELVADLSERGPWKVWKAVRLREPDDLTRGVDRYGGVADGLLLDGWHPTKVGGAGTAFSWDDASFAREQVPGGVDLIAAGGLTPDNVRQAVETLRPDVVDVSSGVELQTGVKDPELIEAFVMNARGEQG